MRKTALVTGINGQDGAYLAKLLLEKDYRVFGLVRRSTRPSFHNLEYLGVASAVDYIEGDLTDEVSIFQAIRLARPDEIYNLAAQSFVGSSWDQPILTAEINAMGVVKLLNAIKELTPHARFYQASTSEMFGNSNRAGLQTENTPFHPRSPYAIAKLFAYWIVNNYKESYGMFCANGILFNHESPIRGKEFVTRKITDGVARIKLGLQDTIRLGNLESKRDWGFAGDYVEAMWMMMQHATPDNYIVSTGETHTIRDFLDLAFRRAEIKNWKDHVAIDPRFKRPAELFTLQGSCSKAARKLKWKPRVKFEELVEMMVDADIERVTQEIKNTANKR
ncbi:TPA: GDP-mannose 4,6-dehydratase [Candidatus Sumerlaeota bacterium]|nr:GDP-mannose 4,6-dehydratase [Candidatus Sumerlaeota bacterium]